MADKLLPLIRFKHYNLFVTSQPYFIWKTSLEPLKELYHFQNQENSNLDFSDSEIEEEKMGEYFWDQLQLDFESINTNYSYVEANANSFDVVRKEVIKKIQNNFQANEVYFVKSKTIESGLIETQEALAKRQYKVIFYPVFQFQNAVATPSVYFVEEKKISNLIFSSSTKSKIYARAFWDYWISKKNLGENQVLTYSLFLLDILDKYTQNQISIFETYSAWIGKTTKSISESLKKNGKIITAEIEKCFKYYGNYSSDSSLLCDKELFNITKALENHSILIKPETKTKAAQTYDFVSIENAIFQINQAVQETQILPLDKESDDTHFGRNPFGAEMIKIAHPEIAGLSGSLLNFKNVIKYIDIKIERGLDKIKLHNDEVVDILKTIITKNWESVAKIINKADDVSVTVIQQLIATLEAKDEIIVWYDFEGFSLPYSIIDGSKPYEQLVFQVSIIKTKNNQIIEKENIVYDPKKLSPTSFKEIINKVYAHKAHKYIVYNKGYEISKLKRMLDYIMAEQSDDLFATKESSNNKYVKKVTHIELNTIDLLDFFKSYSGSEGIPSVFISDLKGFSSIKKIENYINGNDFKLNFKIKPYKNLEIQNGLMAMNAAINRFLGSIGDQEWNNQKVSKLKEYCENDVMAMLMVYDFIKLMLKNKLKK